MDGSANISRRSGIKIAFTPLGVLVALTFIGLPFVVRTVQPVLEASSASRKRLLRALARRAGTRFAALCCLRCFPRWRLHGRLANTAR